MFSDMGFNQTNSLKRKLFFKISKIETYFSKISFYLGIKGFSIFDSDEIDDLEEKIGKMVERGAKKSFSNSF